MSFAAHKYLSPQQHHTGLCLITLNSAWAEGADTLRDVLQPHSASVDSMAKLIPELQLSPLLLCKGQRQLSVLQRLPAHFWCETGTQQAEDTPSSSAGFVLVWLLDCDAGEGSHKKSVDLHSNF